MYGTCQATCSPNTVDLEPATTGMHFPSRNFSKNYFEMHHFSEEILMHFVDTILTKMLYQDARFML
jgi:hypothetical protein